MAQKDVNPLGTKSPTSLLTVNINHSSSYSRSYNNLKTETDHRLVKMTIKLDWYKLKFDTKNEPKYNLGDFNKPNTIKVYKNNIQKKCDNLFTDNMSSQDRWNNICERCKDAGAKVLSKEEKKSKTSR